MSDKVIRPYQGKDPVLHPSSFIAPSADVIGEVEIGSQSSVWFNATVRGDVNWIRVGAGSNLQDNVVVHVTSDTAPTMVGDFVTVGHSAIVHGCTIHDRVLVGIGAIVLDQAVIESDCIIGAGTLVTGFARIPAGSLVLGRPGKVVRSLSEEEMSSIRRHAANYIHYAEIYKSEEEEARPGLPNKKTRTSQET